MEESRFKLNLMPFVVESLGNCKKIYKDIDKLYQSRKLEFYNAAKSSEYYNHQIVTEGSLVQQEYCRKVLGILVLTTEYSEVAIGLSSVIEKGYRWTYRYVETHTTVKVGEYNQAFIRKHKKPEDYDGLPIDLHLNVLIFLSLSYGSLAMDKDYEDLMSLLKFRMDHYNNTTNTRIGLRRASNEDKERIKLLKEVIYRKYGKMRNFDDLVSGKFELKGMEQSAFLFDYERLSSASIFEDIEFTENDIDNIMYLYLIGQRDENDIKAAAEFLISNMYILYMIKAYKQVKDMYFQNNKETTLVEFDGLEKQLKVAETENKALSDALKEGLSEQEKILKENERLKVALEHEKRNRQELNALRDFIFTLDEHEEPKDAEINYDDLKSFKAILIGGHEKWQAKMREILPLFVFIHTDNMNFDLRLLEDTKVVFFYTNYLAHGIYYRAMSAIEGKDIKVIYLRNQNEELVLKEMYKVYKDVYR